MARVQFSLETEQLDALMDKLAVLQEKGEKVINEALHGEGIRLLTEDVTRFMPKSKTSKTHAKDQQWSKSMTENLGFTVVSKGGAANSKGSFGYLIFPDEGRGVKNGFAWNFTGQGAEAALPKIMDILNTNLIKTIEEGI